MMVFFGPSGISECGDNDGTTAGMDVMASTKFGATAAATAASIATRGVMVVGGQISATKTQNDANDDGTVNAVEETTTVCVRGEENAGQDFTVESKITTEEAGGDKKKKKSVSFGSVHVVEYVESQGERFSKVEATRSVDELEEENEFDLADDIKAASFKRDVYEDIKKEHTRQHALQYYDHCKANATAPTRNQRVQDVAALLDVYGEEQVARWLTTDESLLEDAFIFLEMADAIVKHGKYKVMDELVVDETRNTRRFVELLEIYNGAVEYIDAFAKMEFVNAIEEHGQDYVLEELVVDAKDLQLFDDAVEYLKARGETEEEAPMEEMTRPDQLETIWEVEEDDNMHVDDDAVEDDAVGQEHALVVKEEPMPCDGILVDVEESDNDWWVHDANERRLGRKATRWKLSTMVEDDGKEHALVAEEEPMPCDGFGVDVDEGDNHWWVHDENQRRLGRKATRWKDAEEGDNHWWVQVANQRRLGRKATRWKEDDSHWPPVARGGG
ncbi:expressed unknown protein [Seminavis robusta]|uniref:Uncharacterized protein n=1 Tax=Seminavis robusta TaxID=568900 RepID=A0A9N8E4Y1_9STRA|nr:expressed unknown protein [Seminavis robusta]|eukprot:Sro546_g164060.1 n/a (501) ;mRNA; r:25836-27509